MFKYLISATSALIVSASLLLLSPATIFADDILWNNNSNSENEHGNAYRGSVTLCKIIADQEGNIVDGSDHPGGFNFPEVEAPMPPYVPHAAGTIPTTHFETPLVLNADLIGQDDVNDAKCITYENLHLGSYFYAQEAIEGSGWAEPLYNDQYTLDVTTLSDFFPYSRRFSLDGHEDVERWNKNSDGHIVLSGSRPDRTVIVLNRILEVTPPLPVCSDSIDNDQDGKTDSTDPACHSDGNPNNPDTYTPSTDTENSAPVITILGDNPFHLTVGDTFDSFAHATTSDPEDDDVTLHASNTVSTTIAGTYEVNYTAEDEHGLAAVPKKLNVIVEEAPMCLISFTSPMSVHATVGTVFSYTLTATSTGTTTPVFHVATSSLPSGFSFSGNTISGTTTVSGTFNVPISVENMCSTATSTLVIIVDTDDGENPNACSDEADNDGDGKIDYPDDSGCDSPDDDNESNNLPPVADAGSDKTVKTGDTVTFDGSGSSDADGTIVLYEWNFGDGSTATSTTASTTHTYTATSTYTVTLKVFDDKNASSTDTAIVTVVDSFACSDAIDNDEDGKTDSADPACHTDGNPNNPDTYTPTINTENSAPVITVLGANPMNLTVGGTFTDPGASAFDEEDGVIATSSIVVTGTVNTAVAGTYAIHYNVTDSKGLAATEKIRTVNVANGGGGGHIPACSDSADNDQDGKTDSADPACHSDGNPNNPDTYTPSTDTENSAPVITVLGANPMNLTVGNTFTDPGASAFDEEDGAIATSSIVVAGTVNTAVAGTYTIRYNVVDSKGLAATEKTRTVNVANGGGGGGGGGGGCSGNCGGGGSAGGAVLLPPTLRIFNETIEKTSLVGTTLIKWQTNIPADSRVVYGTSSVSVLTNGTNYGYRFGTLTLTTSTTTHSVIVSGLNPNTQYYFRPVSKQGRLSATGKELSLSLNAAPSACYYLREFIKFGENNNPVEVKKLQVFLNSFEGAHLSVTGFYDISTMNAVDAFQDKYKVDVLEPWGHEAPTGYVYLTTRKQVNEVYCRAAFPLDENQTAEVIAFKKLLESLRAHGIAGGENDGVSSSLAAELESQLENQTPAEEEVLPVTGRSAFRNLLGAAYGSVAHALTSYWLIILFAGLVLVAGVLLKKLLKDEEILADEESK